MRCAFSALMVSGFSVMQSQPASSARTMYSSWKPSGQVTMTQSGFVSLSILSKSAARYFFGLAPFGATNLAATSRRPWFTSQTATSSLLAAKVLVIAVRYMREREPTPTFTNLRRLPAAYVLAANPTAATPAVFKRARRSIVDSLIYMSPTLVVTYDPPRRYLKFDHLRSRARTPSINFQPILRRHVFTTRLPDYDFGSNADGGGCAHRPSRAGDPPQPHRYGRRQVGALHGRQRQSGLHRRHHRSADLPGPVFATRAADDPGAVGLAQLSESERLQARAGAGAHQGSGQSAVVSVLERLGAGEEARDPVAARKPPSLFTGTPGSVPGARGW